MTLEPKPRDPPLALLDTHSHSTLNPVVYTATCLNRLQPVFGL
jgi:hypothetical protein